MTGLSIIVLAAQAAKALETGGATCVDLPGESFARAVGSAAQEAALAQPKPLPDPRSAAPLASITRTGADQSLSMLGPMPTTMAR